MADHRSHSRHPRLSCHRDAAPAARRQTLRSAPKGWTGCASGWFSPASTPSILPGLPQTIRTAHRIEGCCPSRLMMPASFSVARLLALFTIRSDNYERLQLAKELEGVRQMMLSLPPMPKGSYAEVIKGPARRLEGTPRALRIDDAVVDALLADIEAGGAKDALPLLAFTLERLYGEYSATGHLKLEHYEKLGRIEGSIEAAVERAFRAADADPKVPKDKQARLALLRRGLIPWLAGIDPDTGAPRRRVARQSEIPAVARPLIDLLIEQRLLSTDVATDALRRLQREQGPSSHVFMTERDGPMTPKAFHALFGRIGARAKMQFPIHPH